jgi:glutathione-independent formaldehyde dehydrogenase
MDGAAYGYAEMGPYVGGRAEFLRISYADFNLLHLLQGTEHETDFTMLSDIFPTGFHGAVLAEVGIGDRVAVYGAGPVGLMAAPSAFLLGTSQVFVVDKVPDRLKLAQAYGATAIDFSQGDPIEQIMDATDGNGVDCGVEAVGYQAHDATARSTRSSSWTGWSTSSVPRGPSAWWVSTKGQRVGTGQAPVKRYTRQLRDLIIAGVAKPGKIVSHEVGLDEAVNAYDKFDCRVDGCTKVLLHPWPAGEISGAPGLGPARPLLPAGVSGNGLQGPAPIADVAEQPQPEPRPEPAQLHVDAARPRRVPPADPVQLLAAPHLAGRGQEQGEQLDLARRQLHRLAAEGHDIGLEVDGEVTDGQWGGERSTGLRSAGAELRRRGAHGAQQSGSALR